MLTAKGMTMDESTMRAFEWASNQNYQSVAARYARTLAEYVKSVGHIEGHKAWKESDFEKLKLESTSGICMKYQIQNCGVCDNIYCSDNTSAAKDAIRTLESTLRSEQTKREELQRQKADALEMLKRLLMHESDCELAALIREMEGE
jgi:hypothetical protein